jgi:asparagine synthase (glutamine-hydrolysing)
MCGITAIYAFRDTAAPVDESELIRIRDRMIPRGPDDAGLWRAADGRVGLAHRRLAIIDTGASGHQPMRSRDGRWHIVFNGEIYNYRALRAALEAEGVVFDTSSDTEVLLALLARRGAGALSLLRGMFAFALWDRDERRLLLARDPLGIKPLYYADVQGTVRVASQVKALLESRAVSREPSPAGAVGFHLWGSVPEPHTLYRDVKALPAGCYLEVDGAGVRAPVAFWSSAEPPQRAAAVDCRDMPAVQEHVRQVLEDSVRAHLVADVPVGVFLSAGIDSSTLCALAAEAQSRPLRTVTLAFDEFRGQAIDESVLAAQIARHYGTEHATITVQERDFTEALPRILDAMDQPTNDGINTYFVSWAAAQAGLKVALSGVGGDELFAGYGTFRNVPRAHRLGLLPGHVGPLRASLHRIADRLPAGRRLPKVHGLIDHAGSLAGAYFVLRGIYMPAELRGLLDPALLDEGMRSYDPIADAHRHLPPGAARPGTVPWPGGGLARSAVSCLESSMYLRNQLLRDADWAGMAHSLEIRTPLVDRVLYEQLAPLVARAPRRHWNKQLLARAPRRPLPAAVAQRPKTGFLVPMTGWLESICQVHADEHWSRAWVRHVFHQFTAGAASGTALPLRRAQA